MKRSMRFLLLMAALALCQSGYDAHAGSGRDSPEALRDALMRAYATRDVDAAFKLFCTAGSSPRYIEMYKDSIRHDFGMSITEATVLISDAAKIHDGPHTVEPLGRVVLHFSRNGQPGPEIYTESFTYIGQKAGRYCFGIPVERD